MNLELLLSPEVPVLKLEDTGERALLLMEDSYLSQLPLVENDTYRALIQNNDIEEWESPESQLSKADFLDFRPLIAFSAHPFEALKKFWEMKLIILPVIDIDEKYIGSITKDTLLNYFADNATLQNPGGIIVMQMEQRNYTLAEIAKICENEDVTITNVQIRKTSNDLLEVTIKLNKTILDAVVASLERHKYTISEVYGVQILNEDLTDNYKLLLHYLNM